MMEPICATSVLCLTGVIPGGGARLIFGEGVTFRVEDMLTDNDVGLGVTSVAVVDSPGWVARELSCSSTEEDDCAESGTGVVGEDAPASLVAAAVVKNLRKIVQKGNAVRTL